MVEKEKEVSMRLMSFNRLEANMGARKELAKGSSSHRTRDGRKRAGLKTNLDGEGVGGSGGSTNEVLVVLRVVGHFRE